MGKAYITTPIYYANDVPHIGHTGTTVFADIIARRHRLLGYDVFFLTGTDEHGEKVAGAAKKAGKEPQRFVDELAVKWQDYWKKLDIQYDHFMRTSLSEHKKIACELLQKLYDDGKIYKGTYKGIYCVGCEEFKSEKDLVDGKCPEHRPDQVQYREEDNYFFKLGEYSGMVEKLLKSGDLPLEPENKRQEILARLSQGVNDISISRENVSWGIPIPWDPKQTTYVWIEALMNYYTATRIWHKEDFWPADLHLLGKGNNWFHSVIWPALLLALGLSLPRKIFVHGYYNVEGRKMGKSLGNVISPQELLNRYGVDGTRYLLAASMPYSDDSDVSFKWFDEKYNSDLANGLGNLVSRLAKLVEGDEEIRLQKSRNYGEDGDLAKAYDQFRLHDVISAIAAKVKNINDYLAKEEPWKKEGQAKTKILTRAVGELGEVAVVLQPIMPQTSAKIAKIFTSGGNKDTGVLFRRL